MNHKTISFIVPTKGRPSLQKTIESINLWPGDELLVIKHNPPSGNWGNSERQEGTDRAKCDFLAYMDDDDVYTTGHREIMDKAIRENPKNYPIMFKMKYPNGRVLWDRKKIACGNVSTQMFLVPNIKDNLHRWEPTRFAADFIFADKWAWPAKLTLWREEIIAYLGHDDEKFEQGLNYSEAKKRGII